MPSELEPSHNSRMEGGHKDTDEIQSAGPSTGPPIERTATSESESINEEDVRRFSKRKNPNVLSWIADTGPTAGDPNAVTGRDDASTTSEEGTFVPNDPANPRNWPKWRKWLIVFAITLIDLTVSWAASGFSPVSEKFAEDFGVSSEVATLGLSLDVLGLAIGPMLQSSLSEYLGRSPIYIVSYGIFLLFLMATALVKSLGGFLALRFLSGLFSSVTVANFGGTIADLFVHDETGIPMSIFLWAATVGSPTGYLLMSFIGQTRPWRDVFWALLGICGGFWLFMVAALKETRHSIILAREKKKIPPNENHARRDQPTKSEKAKKFLNHLFRVTLTRPFRFLFTEAIVMFGALYNGYLYGLSFLFNGAFALVFGKGHGFNTLEVGLAFLGIIIGISLGPLTNALYQERRYQRRFEASGRRNIPESRVQLGKVAAVVFPVSLFWFAWTTYSSVHWIVPIIASAFWGWSFYTLILMTYTYTEDSYGVFSASALAGIGFVRNVAGAGFPLFGRQMFTNLGYQYAGTILACLAIVLVPIPFILERYGERLRRASPWASKHMDVVGDEQPGDVPGENLNPRVESEVRKSDDNGNMSTHV